MPDSDETPDAQLERIKTLTLSARATWFGYLGVLAFATVTLAGVRDIDFFSYDSATELPLIGISVPTVSFFLATSALIALFFGYLHVFLEQLWHALSEPPSEIGGAPLNHHIQPWLVSEFALHIRRRLRPDEPPCVSSSALGGLGILASAGLLYAAGPAILAGFWYRSMPAHFFWLTGIISVLLWISIWTGWASARAIYRKFDPADQGGARTAHPVTTTVLACLLVALVPVSAMRTTWDRWDTAARQDGNDMARHADASARLVDWFRPVRADLNAARLTELPDDWQPFQIARKAAFAEWCGRPDTPSCPKETDLGSFPNYFWSYEFTHEWETARDTYIRVLRKADLRGRNLSGAELAQAHLPGIDLRSARLEGANLRGAQVEGANLSEAQMRGTDLSLAQMEGADLSTAVLEGATLSEALMEGADLREARLQRAILANAHMGGADLSGAQLQDTDLQGANLQDATLTNAQLEGANLTRALMRGAELGNAQLQRAHLFGAELQDADLGYAQMPDAKLIGAQLQNARLFGAQLRGANLSGAQLQGASLIGTKLKGADLSRAQLQGANLRGVFLSGTDARRMVLEETNLGGATADGGALRFADLRNAVFDDATDFQNSFADASVDVPAGFVRPCQWAKTELSDEAFFGRWRGWIGMSSTPQTWSWIAPEGFEDVTPLPPPPDCAWTTDRPLDTE